MRHGDVLANVTSKFAELHEKATADQHPESVERAGGARRGEQRHGCDQ
jgi:hypothetical protein